MSLLPLTLVVLDEKCVDGQCQNCKIDTDCNGKGPNGANWKCAEFRCQDPAAIVGGPVGPDGIGKPCAQTLDCAGGTVCKAGACAAGGGHAGAAGRARRGHAAAAGGARAGAPVDAAAHTDRGQRDLRGVDLDRPAGDGAQRR